MKSFQHQRPNPQKPTVAKLFTGGMWWAQVHDRNGRLHCKPFGTHSDALEQAYKYAAMNEARS